MGEASGRGSPGSHIQPLRAAARREALPVRRQTHLPSLAVQRMRKSMAGQIIVTLILLAVGALLAFFSIQNANRYWESSHPPDGAELVAATVVEVNTEEVCGRTTRSTSSCTSEVDGLEIGLSDGSSHHVHAHAVFSPGDEVEAFQDTEGDWQVQGAFTGSWVARTAGLTGLGAVAMLVLAGANLRPGLKDLSRS